MRRRTAAICLCLLAMFLTSGCGAWLMAPAKSANKQAPPAKATQTAPPAKQADAVKAVPPAKPADAPKPLPKGQASIRIGVVGDILMHMPETQAGKQPDGSYDFRGFFTEMEPYFRRTDLMLGNFETSISTRELGFSGYPMFKSPEEILFALKAARFDVLTTANNHSLDGREEGLIRTLDRMDKYGLQHTGTARSTEEREKPLIVTRKDIKVAVHAYTYGCNGMEGTLTKAKLAYAVNLIDMAVIERDVKASRAAGADLVIVCMHWGQEYVRKPDQSQRLMAERLVAMGVDVIFGSHPHVLEPMEWRRVLGPDGKQRDAFVIYSLGNFISNQTNDMIKFTDSGAMLSLEVTKDFDTGAVTLGDLYYLPTWVYRYQDKGRLSYRVLPVGEFRTRPLGREADQRIQAVWKETTDLMGPGFKAR